MMDDRTASWTPPGGPQSPASGAHRMPVPGELLAGRFLLLHVLGTGGSGVVFAARDVRLDQTVAIKILHPTQVDSRGLQRLRREVQAARGSHPNMVSVYDLHESGGLHFLSMELVEGVSLRERLREGKRLDVAATVRLGRQIASALAHLHERGIVHRDVKPGNILLTAGGTAKLCDMGLARALERGLTVTETAMVVGTPAYMAPEQATGEELTPAADVYGLGVTLYQALTGEVPLTDTTALSTLMRRQKERAPSPRKSAPETPRWLARLLTRMLDPDPGRRPGAGETERALGRGRYSYRPRPRNLAALAALLVAAGSVPVIHSQIRRGETVRLELRGGDAVGLDARGRTTWTHAIGPNVTGSVRADFDGDGRKELAIVTGDDDTWRERQRRFAGVTIVDRRGHVLLSARLRDLIGRWNFPYPLRFSSDLQAVDLDGDGRPELVVLVHQVHFFPSELLVYWPALDRWQPVLEHPGYVRSVAALPDPEHPVLRFVGLANRPIYTPVAGSIVLEPHELGPSTLESRQRLEPALRAIPGAFLQWYTLLEPQKAGRIGNAIQLQVSSNGASVIADDMGAIFRLDRLGNPEPGPNGGRDLRAARCTFMHELKWLDTYTDAGDGHSVRTLTRRLRTRFAPLLAERAYRVALDVEEARALARVGAHGAAIELLHRTVEDTHNDDAVLVLANLLGVAGRLHEAAALLEPAVATPLTQRANFDGRILLFKLALELGDPSLMQRCLFHFGVRARQIDWGTGTVAAFRARAHLWWDRVTPSDAAVHSWPYEPAGDALACLARWRLGRSTAGDSGRMREGARRNPDAAEAFRVAEAAAELGLGRPGKAVLLLDRLEARLHTTAVADFGAHQLLDLARALHARALLAAGQPAEARSEAGRLLPRLTPGRLPASICQEVATATEAPGLQRRSAGTS